MGQHELTFVIPTYRLRDVGETVEQYDQHCYARGEWLVDTAMALETNATKDSRSRTRRWGSVPEVLEDGVTGCIVDSVDETRRVFQERFDAPRMAEDYLDVYRGLVPGC